jgi:hypothetical protein
MNRVMTKKKVHLTWMKWYIKTNTIFLQGVDMKIFHLYKRRYSRKRELMFY